MKKRLTFGFFRFFVGTAPGILVVAAAERVVVVSLAVRVRHRHVR